MDKNQFKNTLYLNAKKIGIELEKIIDNED